jgi:hypothetical protein
MFLCLSLQANVVLCDSPVTRNSLTARLRLVLLFAWWRVLGPRRALRLRPPRRVKRTRAESDAECSRITSARPQLIAPTRGSPGILILSLSLRCALCVLCADSEFIMMDAIYNREYEC